MDTDNISKEHKTVMQSILSDEYGVGYTEQQKKQIFNMYKELKKIPKKDWDKQSTKDKIKDAQDKRSIS